VEQLYNFLYSKLNIEPQWQQYTYRKADESPEDFLIASPVAPWKRRRKISGWTKQHENYPSIDKPSARE
jgi:hypothetical protein